MEPSSDISSVTSPSDQKARTRSHLQAHQVVQVHQPLSRFSISSHDHNTLFSNINSQQPYSLGYETSHVQNFRGLGCNIMRHQSSINPHIYHVFVCTPRLLIWFNYFLGNYFYAILFWREHISGHIVPLQRLSFYSDIFSMLLSFRH